MTATTNFFNGFKKGTTVFGEEIIRLVNSLLLTVVYLLGIGITSIVARLARKRFLDTTWKKKGSYWSDKDTTAKEVKKYERQF